LRFFPALLALGLPLAAKAATAKENAHIKILNVCDTSQADRWRTGVDLRFQERTIGKDIRMGERGPLGRITFTGKDFIEIFRAGGDPGPLLRVPATLKASGVYTLVVMGQLDAASTTLDVRVIEEYPIPKESIRPEQCRIQLLNALQKFPVAVEINRQKAPALAFGETCEIFLTPGEVTITLIFGDGAKGASRLQSGMVAKPGDNYTLVIHPSAERSDRPELFRANAAAERAASDR
jgi:hypothetical protein